MRIDGRRNFTDIDLTDGRTLVIQKSQGTYSVYIQAGYEIVQHVLSHASKEQAQARANQIIERDADQHAEETSNPEGEYIREYKVRDAVAKHVRDTTPTLITIFDSEGSTIHKQPFNVHEIVRDLTADDIGCIVSDRGLNVTFTGEYLGLTLHDASDSTATETFINSLGVTL